MFVLASWHAGMRMRVIVLFLSILESTLNACLIGPLVFWHPVKTATDSGVVVAQDSMHWLPAERCLCLGGKEHLPMPDHIPSLNKRWNCWQTSDHDSLPCPHLREWRARGLHYCRRRKECRRTDEVPHLIRGRH